MNDPRALLDLDLAALGRTVTSAGPAQRADLRGFAPMVGMTGAAPSAAVLGSSLLSGSANPRPPGAVAHRRGPVRGQSPDPRGGPLLRQARPRRGRMRVAAQHRAGRLDLTTSGADAPLPTGVQAAEIQVRRELGLDRFDAVVLGRAPPAGRAWQVRFVTDAGPVHVTSRPRTAGTARLTCAATLDNPVIAWDCELVSEGRPVLSGTPPADDLRRGRHVEPGEPGPVDAPVARTRGERHLPEPEELGRRVVAEPEPSTVQPGQVGRPRAAANAPAATGPRASSPSRVRFAAAPAIAWSSHSRPSSRAAMCACTATWDAPWVCTSWKAPWMLPVAVPKPRART